MLEKPQQKSRAPLWTHGLTCKRGTVLDCARCRYRTAENGQIYPAQRTERELRIDGDTIFCHFANHAAHVQSLPYTLIRLSIP